MTPPSRPARSHSRLGLVDAAVIATAERLPRDG
jgi:hypothetical protein